MRLIGVPLLHEHARRERGCGSVRLGLRAGRKALHERVERARAYAAGARTLAFENTGAIARHAAQQAIVFGQEIDPDVTIDLLDAVTLGEVREVAAGIADELSVACVGPHTVQEFESA